MRVLWAPRRLRYIEKGVEEPGCIFCDKPALTSREQRRDALLLCATERASVIMNRYPYASGHLMVAPRVHGGDFAALDAESAAAVQHALQASVRVLTRAYQPAGF